MSEKRRDVASARQLEADVFARLAKRESHEAIAAALDVSRQHVTRIAAKFRARLEQQAEATKEAAIDGALEARRIAREAAPEIMQALVDQALDADLPPAERRAAAVAVLDRGGAHPKADLEVGVRPLDESAAQRVAAAVRALEALPK